MNREIIGTDLDVLARFFNSRNDINLITDLSETNGGDHNINVLNRLH